MLPSQVGFPYSILFGVWNRVGHAKHSFTLQLLTEDSILCPGLPSGPPVTLPMGMHCFPSGLFPQWGSCLHHWKPDALFSCLVGQVLPPTSPLPFVKFCLSYFGLFFIFICFFGGGGLVFFTVILKIGRARCSRSLLGVFNEDADTVWDNCVEIYCIFNNYYHSSCTLSFWPLISRFLKLYF